MLALALVVNFACGNSPTEADREACDTYTAQGPREARLVTTVGRLADDEILRRAAEAWAGALEPEGARTRDGMVAALSADVAFLNRCHELFNDEKGNIDTSQ